MRARLLVPCLLVPCLLLSCAPQPLTVTREPASVRLVAADSCGPMVESLAAAYEQTRPWVTVHVEVLNSAMAEQTLRESEADLALLSWLQETSYEEPLWNQVFGRDGIAVIAHPSVPFDATGLAHLQDIFRGRIQEWGGAVLVAVIREDGAGARRIFDGTVLGIHKITHTAVVMASNEAVVEHVTRTQGAIGYVSTLRLAESDAANVQVLPVENTLPTPDDIADGSYPLWRPLYLASVAEPTGEAREFAQWMLGPEGQAIVNTRTN